MIPVIAESTMIQENLQWPSLTSNVGKAQTRRHLRWRRAALVVPGPPAQRHLSVIARCQTHQSPGPSAQRPHAIHPIASEPKWMARGRRFHLQPGTVGSELIEIKSWEFEDLNCKHLCCILLNDDLSSTICFRNQFQYCLVFFWSSISKGHHDMQDDILLLSSSKKER